jgi:hypothetical protein
VLWIVCEAMQTERQFSDNRNALILGERPEQFRNLLGLSFCFIASHGLMIHNRASAIGSGINKANSTEKNTSFSRHVL